MTSSVSPTIANLDAASARGMPRLRVTPLGIATAVAFALLFAKPAALLFRDWLHNPEAGHGLLLAPLALVLAWRQGLVAEPRPQKNVGLALLAIAVVLRYASGLAAELFTMRGSMVMALVALTIFLYGWRQVMAWWLPFTLIALSIPLPEVVLSAAALPLQFKASQLGAMLLKARYVPVVLSGNIIQLPGQALFVTEACSGLRSLTALLSLGVLLGGTILVYPISRIVLLLLAIPIAVALNAIRVFATGYTVHYISPAAGKGVMHFTEGWLLFAVAFVLLGAIALVGRRLEEWKRSSKPDA